jgi:2-polyprenyl-3-methyl-5-hydroxy-6-metoxy-1,4-benzoquinol methylase
MHKIFKNKREMIDGLINEGDCVLDVGFWGQGVNASSQDWVHKMIIEKADKVHGIDLDYDDNNLPQGGEFYVKSSAENFFFKEQFDVVFAGDLMEHLSNPGLFLECAKKNLKIDGRLVITTPNCFNFFNLTEKISKYEPTINCDHTMYFNIKTIKKLFHKNGFEIVSIAFLYKLDSAYSESVKKKFLNIIYYLLSKITDKFIENIVIVAKKQY